MKHQIFSTLAVTGIAVTSVFIPFSAQAQRVVGVNPAVETKGVSPDTSISGLFETEEGETIKINSVRIFVNGEDVTEESTITPKFFGYRPDTPLSSGQHEVKVEYRNTMGEQRSANWTFSVQKPTQNLTVDSVMHNAEGEALGSGATFSATIKGTPNANASVLMISETMDQVQNLPAKEVSSGVYVTTFNVAPENKLDKVVIIGRLEKDDQIVHAAASDTAQFAPSVASDTDPMAGQESETVETEEMTEESSQNTAAADPLRPAFSSHQNGDKVNAKDGLVLKGQTKPNAEVSVEANAKRRVLGGLFSINSTDFANKQVVADENGRFEVMLPAPPTIASGIRYTIRAIATQGEEESKVTKMRLIQE